MVFFFQAEDGIRDLVRSRGLGDVYKRQALVGVVHQDVAAPKDREEVGRYAVRRGEGPGVDLSLIHI